MTAIAATSTVDYRSTTTGTIDLYRDGERQRTAIRSVSAKRTVTILLDHLHQALALGAAYGPRNDQRELADCLLGRETPGLVLYDVKPATHAVTMRKNGVETEIVVPASLTLTRRVEFVNELQNAFDMGGRYGHNQPEEI